MLKGLLTLLLHRVGLKGKEGQEVGSGRGRGGARQGQVGGCGMKDG